MLRIGSTNEKCLCCKTRLLTGHIDTRQTFKKVLLQKFGGPPSSRPVIYKNTKKELGLARESREDVLEASRLRRQQKAGPAAWGLADTSPHMSTIWLESCAVSKVSLEEYDRIWQDNSQSAFLQPKSADSTSGTRRDQSVNRTPIKIYV